VALKQAAGQIPIVFVQVTDPVGAGLVASLAQPGGNVTGFTNFEFSMGAKWVELLREIDHDVERVGALYNPATAPYGAQYVNAIRQAARSLNIAVETGEVNDAEGAAKFIDSLNADGDALIVLPDIFTGANFRSITDKASARRLLAIYPFPHFTAAGGIIS